MDVAAASDEALMVAWTGGDAAAFDALFDRYAPVLLRMMRRSAPQPEIAGELVQQTFVQLHRSRLDWRPDRPLRPWLLAIGRNVLRDFQRRHRRRPEAYVDADADGLTEAPDQEAAVTAGDVRAAVKQLPDAQREILELHWFEGVPLREVAEVVGASHGAVKVRAHRAYQRLREILGGVTGRAASANASGEGAP